MAKTNSVACGTPMAGPPRRLGSTNATVIIVVLVLAVLVYLQGKPVSEVLWLLASAGGVAVAITGLAGRRVRLAVAVRLLTALVQP